MKAFLSLRKSSNFVESEPLFKLPGNHFLTKALFVRQTRLLLSAIGIPPGKYSGHSYRAGGATDAARVGFLDWEVKMLGRWASDAYQRYIRTPEQFLIGFSKRLLATGDSNIHFRQSFTKNIYE